MKSLVIFFMAVTLAAALEDTLDIPERIINGTRADPCQFPYMVGLKLYNETVTRKCGGSLISSIWVLTAAHCTNEMNAAEVRLGSTLWERPDVSFKICNINFTQHEKYKEKFNSYDIALIKIPPVEFTNNIKIIELTKKNQRHPQGKKVVVSGWGDIDDNGNEPISLRYAEMIVISTEDCRTKLQNIGARKLCATSFNGGSICGGDSGGPMVLKDKNILIGVTSVGSKNCTDGLPAVFTRVSWYLNWIANHTGIGY